MIFKHTLYTMWSVFSVFLVSLCCSHASSLREIEEVDDNGSMLPFIAPLHTEKEHESTDATDIDTRRAEQLIYSHVNVITHNHTGVHQSHVSEAGDKYIGISCRYEYFLIENFTVPEEEVWFVDEVEVLAYQTGSSTRSTFTALYFMIYDKHPLEGGNILWGDNVTNIMKRTSFTNIYRIAHGASHAGDSRPIMRIAGKLTAQLTAGTYHTMFATSGTLGSGPWCPPIATGGTVEQFDDISTLKYNGDTTFKFYAHKEKSSSTKSENIVVIVAPIVVGGVVIIGAVLMYISLNRKNDRVYVEDTAAEDIEKSEKVPAQ